MGEKLIEHDKYHLLWKPSKLLLYYKLAGMSVIYVLITVSIIVAIVFFIAFVAAVKNGQFDDDYTPSIRILFDDELVKQKKDTNQQSSNKQS